ncbi:MAG: NAD(P)H-hydrate dehydratase [Acidimicrobiales bacterium]
MIPIVTPDRMAAVDAAAASELDQLIERAGRAVAREALTMLGGTYGRRVVVLVGPGNNGADGRAAARRLRHSGVRVREIEVGEQPAVLPAADLVIDAAFGNGLRRPYLAPDVLAGTSVLAVDIPSGVDGLTGERVGEPMAADRTVTFGGLKPGLVLEPGRSLAGAVVVADIGLELGEVRVHAVDDADVTRLLSGRSADDHKWKAGVRVVGGAPGMTGAAALAARAAQRCGAGIVQMAMPGGRGDEGPLETVGHPLPREDWADEAFASVDERIQALLLGCGLGPIDRPTLEAACRVDRPLVLDGGALQPELVPLLGAREAPTVLTPHDGEWHRLAGPDRADRISSTQAFALEHGVTVARKGPTTIVAAPDGSARVVTSGTAALATAGTGDVLGGAILGLLARGHAGPDAATIAAHVHGLAGARLGLGLVASEVAEQLPALLAELRPVD